MIRLSTKRLPGGKRWTRMRISNLVAAVAALMLFASTQVSPEAADLEISEFQISAGTTAQKAAENELAVELGNANKDENSLVSLSSPQNRGLKLSLFKFRR